MQDNSVFNLPQTKKAAILNFVSLILLILLVATFFILYYTDVIGSGIDYSSENGNNESLGFGIVLALFLPFLFLSFILLGLVSIYKIIFATLLAKACKSVQTWQSSKKIRRLFVASLVTTIVTVVLLLISAFFVYGIIDAGKTPVLAIIFALLYVLLAVFDVVCIFAEKKSRQELLESVVNE